MLTGHRGACGPDRIQSVVLRAPGSLESTDFETSSPASAKASASPAAKLPVPSNAQTRRPGALVLAQSSVLTYPAPSAETSRWARTAPVLLSKTARSMVSRSGSPPMTNSYSSVSMVIAVVLPSKGIAVDAPVRWGAVARQDRRDDVLEALGRAHLLHPRTHARVELLEMVAVAGQSPHGRAAGDRRPAEHGAVEGLCGLDIVGVEVIEVHRAMLVDGRRAAVRPGLPDAEDRALRIGEDTHPPRLKDVEGLGEHLPASPTHAGRGVVGGLDADIGVPRGLRWRAGGQ